VGASEEDWGASGREGEEVVVMEEDIVVEVVEVEVGEVEEGAVEVIVVMIVVVICSVGVLGSSLIRSFSLVVVILSVSMMGRDWVCSKGTGEEGEAEGEEDIGRFDSRSFVYFLVRFLLGPICAVDLSLLIVGL
jgi:hypothetical protein